MISWLSLESLELVKNVIAIILAYLIIAGVAGAFQAWMTEKAGDDTAAEYGMKTINPFAHVDPTSLWLMPLGYMLFRVIIGLSRPVPIIWNNIVAPWRKLKMFLIAIAQPLAILGILVLMLILQTLVLVLIGVSKNFAYLSVEIGVYDYIMRALVGFSVWFIPYQLLMSVAQIFIYELEQLGMDLSGAFFGFFYTIVLILVPLFGAVLLIDVSNLALMHFLSFVGGGIESVAKLVVTKGGLS